MGVYRIVPNLPSTDVARGTRFYADLFDLEIAMDLGWVGNIAPRDTAGVQMQVMTTDAGAAVNPVMSIGVATPDEVDAAHARLVAAGVEIVHPLTDEEWGVRRFFFRDPDGNVINVVANR